MHTIKAKLTQKFPSTSGVGNNNREWTKCDFIASTEGRGARTIKFTAWNTVVDQVMEIAVGSELDIEFEVGSREYQGRWYTDVTAKKITGDMFVPTAKEDQQAAAIPSADKDPRAVEMPKLFERAGDDFFSNTGPVKEEAKPKIEHDPRIDDLPELPF